ncbi:MAG: HK97 family phage prohead protease [Acidobacteriota bacterium]
MSFRLSGRRPGIRQADAYSRLAAGVSQGLSIGFRLLDSRKEPPFRLITKAELVELSLTAFPVLAGAGITAMKADQADPIRRLLLARLQSVLFL